MRIQDGFGVGVVAGGGGSGERVQSNSSLAQTFMFIGNLDKLAKFWIPYLP